MIQGLASLRYTELNRKLLLCHRETQLTETYYYEVNLKSQSYLI